MDKKLEQSLKRAEKFETIFIIPICLLTGLLWFFGLKQIDISGGEGIIFLMIDKTYLLFSFLIVLTLFLRRIIR